MLHVDRIASSSQSSKVDYRLALTMDPLDLDPGFEPQTRARSNTWPLPRPDNFVEEGGKGPPAAPSCEGPKKNSSRRNAWGNMSYADLITQAIQSSPEKRLTLAQIYEWMVQNVAYFKDKGDSNSSAGWKNSIRHNLSLHNRFMRVQNEGTGKSSWWMINPDAKPGKAARRRATSMETHKYEKKRGRVKKKVEALRNNGATPSPSSSVSEGQDLFPESPGGLPHFQQLSPPDPFRPRASSNASSCGRLSPIPAAPDSDIPPLSPIPWTYEHMDRSYTTDHLVKSLSESMKLRCSGGDPDSSFGLSSDCAVKPVSNGARGFGLVPAPPYYASNGEYRTTQSYQPSPSPPQQQVIETVSGRSYTLTRLQSIPQQQSQPSTLCDTYRQMSTYLDTPPPLYKDIKEEPQDEPSCPLSQPSWPKVASYHPQQQQSLLQQPQQQQTSLVNTANHVVGHLLYNSLPQDLDFDPLPGGFECDVDQVIRHELSVEGNLDFNFDSAAATSTSNPSTTLSSTRSWVH